MKALILLLALLVCAAPADAVPVYVSGSDNGDFSGSSMTTLSTSAGIATAAHNHIVVAVRWGLGGGGDPTVTDTAGNTYTQAPTCSPIAIAGAQWLALFYAEDVAGHASDVFTATWPMAASYTSIVAIQRSGLALSGSFDACANSGGSDTTPTCTTGMFTTTQADEELVTIAQQVTVLGNFSAGGSAVERQASRYMGTNEVVSTQTEVVSSIQTNATASMTSTTTGDACSAIVATFKSAAAVSYINGATGTVFDGSSVLAVATDAFTVTGGNHLVVAVRWGFGGGGDPVLTDTAGNTFIQVPTCSPIDRSAGNEWLALFYAENVTGNASDVITATWMATTQYDSIVAVQHAGLATSSSYDTCANNNTGVTPTCTTGTFTTATATELIVMAAQQEDAFVAWSAGGGATMRNQDAFNAVGVQSQLVSAIQTGATASMTSAGMGQICSSLVATFKGAVAAPTVSRRSGIWWIK